MGKFAKEELEKLSLPSLTKLYNELAAKPIKRFTGSKAAAVARLMELGEAVPVTALEAPLPPAGTTMEGSMAGEKATKATKTVKGKAKAKAPAARKGSAKPKGERARREGTVRAAVEDGLKKGMSDEAIIKTVRRQFPDTAFGKDEAIAKKHVSWYKWKLGYGKKK